MTKRPKGQRPIESRHPEKIWQPDMPGHQQKIVNNEIKNKLEEQIARLSKEIVGGGRGLENRG